MTSGLRLKHPTTVPNGSYRRNGDFFCFNHVIDADSHADTHLTVDQFGKMQQKHTKSSFPAKTQRALTAHDSFDINVLN